MMFSSKITTLARIKEETAQADQATVWHDNKIAETVDWDEEMLKVEIKAL